MTEDELEAEYLEMGRTLLKIIKENWCPERSKREDKYFVIKGSKECVSLDAIPSEECKEYHNNSCIQINHDNKSYLMRCSEHSGN